MAWKNKKRQEWKREWGKEGGVCPLRKGWQSFRMPNRRETKPAAASISKTESHKGSGRPASLSVSPYTVLWDWTGRWTSRELSRSCRKED